MNPNPDKSSLSDTCRQLDNLGDRVGHQGQTAVDSSFLRRVERIIRDLEQMNSAIPGFYEAPDRQAGLLCLNKAQNMSLGGNFEGSLREALFGLRFSPQDSGLWYAVGKSLFEFGHKETALRAMDHALWIHPGHKDARRDATAIRSLIAEEKDPLKDSNFPYHKRPTDEDQS